MVSIVFSLDSLIIMYFWRNGSILTSYEFHDADLCVNLGFKDLFFSLKTDILSDLSIAIALTGYDTWPVKFAF